MLCVLGSNRNERPRKLFEEGLCRGWITIEKPFKGERGVEAICINLRVGRAKMILGQRRHLTQVLRFRILVT